MTSPRLIKLIKLILPIFFFLLFFGFAKTSQAATYWVSPTGSATWASCQSVSPLSDTAACSRAVANTNAQAGDTVYFRGGTYSVSNTTAINPTNSGTSANAKIIFSAYANEIPIFEQSVYSMGIDINGKSWIKITGMTFKDMTGTSVIRGDAHYNEISYNSFVNTVNVQVASRIFVLGNNTSAPWSTHNWFHHNYLSRRANSNPCNEGIDLLRVGMAVNNEHDDYNTVEDNYFEYSGHANLVTYGKHLVIRGNIAHNEPWITGCTVYNGGVVDLYGKINGSTATDSLTISTGSKTLTIATELETAPPAHWYAGYPVSIASNANMANAMSGSITSYNPTTGELVVNITNTIGSGTFTDWVVSTKNIPYYDNHSEWFGLYAHRVFAIGDNDLGIDHNNLVEGNRLGFGGVNPNNNGPSTLDIQSRKNIVRYNYAYGGMGNGISFKSAVGAPTYSGGVLNHVYNNTVYNNGINYNYTIYSGLNAPNSGQGIGQGSSGGNQDNVIKNNIVYANSRGDICPSISNQIPTCLPWSGDTVINNWTTNGSGQGNPLFVNPDLSDPLSQNLIPSAHGYTSTPIPNFALQSSSPAINGGTYLTETNGSGNNSTTLVVDDSMYFQDGSWGSDLARGVSLFPDWIAIGTVNNTVQISSINYDTNTITLSSPKTWSDNAPVWLYKKSDGTQVLYGSAPDYGAHEYVGSAPIDTTPPSPPSSITIALANFNRNLANVYSAVANQIQNMLEQLKNILLNILDK